MTTLIPKFDLMNGGLTPAGAINRPINEKLQESISVKDFGAIGDNIAIDTIAIQNALNAARDAGGGTVYFPIGTYLIDNALNVYSNTTIIMFGTVKVYAMEFGETYETAFITDITAPTNNIAFINPQIDCNNVAPSNAIIIRNSATNVRIEGGYIRNCANTSTMSGGRAINLEGGGTTSNITVTGTTIENCWNGVSVSGGGSIQANSNISVSNLAIKDCQIAISLFGNADGYPHSAEFMQAEFSNISIRNCGSIGMYFEHCCSFANSD